MVEVQNGEEWRLYFIFSVSCDFGFGSVCAQANLFVQYFIYDVKKQFSVINVDFCGDLEK